MAPTDEWCNIFVFLCKEAPVVQDCEVRRMIKLRVLTPKTRGVQQPGLEAQAQTALLGPPKVCRKS